MDIEINRQRRWSSISLRNEGAGYLLDSLCSRTSCKGSALPYSHSWIILEVCIEALSSGMNPSTHLVLSHDYPKHERSIHTILHPLLDWTVGSRWCGLKVFVGFIQTCIRPDGGNQVKVVSSDMAFNGVNCQISFIAEIWYLEVHVFRTHPWKLCALVKVLIKRWLLCFVHAL